MVSLLLVLASGVALASCATASSTQGLSNTFKNNNSYGGLPSWLPTATAATNEVLRASVHHPQLGIEGNTMRVHLLTGDVLVTMTGPTVPPFVAPPPPVTTATFTINVRSLSGTVLVKVADFAVVDGYGHVFRPATFAGGATQDELRPGHRVVLRLSEVMAVGSGSLTWAPTGRPITTWEFTVEND